MKSKKVIRAYFIFLIFYYIKNNFPVYIKNLFQILLFNPLIFKELTKYNNISYMSIYSMVFVTAVVKMGVI